MNARTVWVAKDDGSDIIRADVAGVCRDYNGDITARLAGGEGLAVTLVAPASGAPSTPEDFHRKLIKIAAELFHTAETRGPDEGMSGKSGISLLKGKRVDPACSDMA